MSIAKHSVVGRILSEVAAGEVPHALFEVERSCETTQLLELRRSTRLHRPPFATPLHFWAHALRALLEDRGRPDLFDAIATDGLCRAVAGEELSAGLRELAARVAEPPELDLRVPFETGYCMLEQEEMASFVAERPGESLAVFWLRPDWLAEAEPWEPEDEEASIPGRGP